MLHDYLIIHSHHVMLCIRTTKYFHQNLLINSVEQVLKIILSMLARNTLHSSHDVIKQFIIHLHHQTGLTIRALLYVEDIDQPLDGAALEEDSLHDDDEGGGDHHVDIRNMVWINSDDQREAHCSSQTTVGHHKHLLASDRVNAAAALVNREAEEVGGEESNNENEEDGPKCEADIPDMIVSEPGDA